MERGTRPDEAKTVRTWLTDKITARDSSEDLGLKTRLCWRPGSSTALRGGHLAQRQGEISGVT